MEKIQKNNRQYVKYVNTYDTNKTVFKTVTRASGIENFKW